MIARLGPPGCCGLESNRCTQRAARGRADALPLQGARARIAHRAAVAATGRSLARGHQAGVRAWAAAAVEPAAVPPATSVRAELPTAPPTGLRAVVCGSGVAGLVTARVLADHFDEVLLLERDTLPMGQLGSSPGAGDHSGSAAPAAAGGEAAAAAAAAATAAPAGGALRGAADAVAAKRRGVPQYLQPHVMLTRGLDELDKLFPGFRDELVAAGAVQVETPRGWHICDARMGGVLEHTYSAFQMMGASRSLVETALRVRVARDCPNVTTVTGAPVEGLTFDGAGLGSAVTGVRVRGGAPVAADLVVDASGRGSRVPEWMEAAGWAPPVNVTVDSGLVYTSAVYQLPADWAGPQAIMAMCKPPDGRSGLLLPVEGGRHHVILAGRGAERCAPTDEAVLQFCATLPDTVLHDALAGATRISDIRTYERTANFRRKYEDVAVPPGLAVIGDGVCSFNPVYGQGMSVAVLQALSLGRELVAALPPRAGGGEARAGAARAALPRASAAFMRGVGEVVSVPWALATGNDAPFVGGVQRSALEAGVDWVFNEVARLGQRDAEVHSTLMRVMHMLEPPTALVAPRMLARLAADKLAGALRLRAPRAA